MLKLMLFLIILPIIILGIIGIIGWTWVGLQTIEEWLSKKFE